MWAAQSHFHRVDHGRARSAEGCQHFYCARCCHENRPRAGQRDKTGRRNEESSGKLKRERTKVAAHRGATRAGLHAPPKTRLQKPIRVVRSIPRLPVRSGPGGEIDRNEATQAVGPEFVGERTAGWRTAAGEIAGREWAK